MTEAVTSALDWQTANQRALSAALAVIRHFLEIDPAALKQKNSDELQFAEKQYRELTCEMSSPPALETLVQLFGLSAFERNVLLLCAGAELDSSFAASFAAAHGNPLHPYPTFGLALATMPHAHWSALAPDAPLRYWRLLEFAQGGSPGAPNTTRPLRIDERILHYLTGISHLDERLAASAQRASVEQELMPSHERIAQQILTGWKQAGQKHAGRKHSPADGRWPIILLSGPSAQNIQTLAARACVFAGWDLHVISSDAVPTGIAERNSFMRLWERESVLSRTAVLLDHHDHSQTEPTHAAAVSDFIQKINAALMVSSRERPRFRGRPSLEFDVKPPTPAEQGAEWRLALGELAVSFNGGLDILASQFSLTGPAIRSAATSVRSSPAEGKQHLLDGIWEECRRLTRTRMDDLAQRIESAAAWDDLVLPDAQKDILREIVAHVKCRNCVYESWGFATKGGRGLGISALFAGASGTGKTMAGEVLARDLRLDLYRIDLSSVISKYIGETEKNLRRLFDAAEEGGAILLFDEADALFGKRSEVKDSHDRYANIEVSYLLQRMECYRGLAILTTNFKSALDAAFLRRIRFVLQFPFPDAEQRAEIWRRIFPASTPTRGLELQKLAQLNVPGGNIRNIALNSAFLAADEASDVRMSHILRAARSEYAKLEKTLTEGETHGWE
jgi:hypothetical protein